ncbi:MAG: ribbon-helix-helix domain-containing protein [Trebonia sp.]
MGYRDDPSMMLVNAWMPRADADALVRLANAQGMSRSALLRRVARELIENHTDGATND